MARALMIQGTGSGVGKSLIVTGLCRIFRKKGINVAPFKAQNMALNSFITKEGGEIGRAQALQARAAGLEPSNDMNPVLLKASGESGSQVIIQGRVHSTMKAVEYYAFRNEAWRAVTDSFDRLSSKHELIVIEGAGSPAEINLMDVDIVNMAMAKYAGSPVILVGDIERGGVFASLYGTIGLLGGDAGYVKGFVINRFRGERSILDPGLDMLKGLTGRPVIGVLPYIRDISLPEEDGLALGHKPAPDGHRWRDKAVIKIVVVRLRYISNFTDFDPFMHEPDVELLYSTNPADIESSDIVIIPGSKNTVKDLMFLRESGLSESIYRAAANNAEIIGICGGYQMMGRKIMDPYGVEGDHSCVEGLGLLDIETVFDTVKITCRVNAEIIRSPYSEIHGSHISPKAVCAELEAERPLQGYEIHMGRTGGNIGLFRLRRMTSNGLDQTEILDGSAKGNCWGTYLHGIFENDLFRRSMLNRHRRMKGLEPVANSYSYSDMQEKAIDGLADIIERHIDMGFISRMVSL